MSMAQQAAINALTRQLEDLQKRVEALEAKREKLTLKKAQNGSKR